MGSEQNGVVAVLSAGGVTHYWHIRCRLRWAATTPFCADPDRAAIGLSEPSSSPLPLERPNRVEATIFAASEPVTRETLARIVGKTCSIDLLIDDIREELRGRPYDLIAVAGGVEASDPSGLCRRDPGGRRRQRAYRRPHPVRGAGVDVHSLLPAEDLRIRYGV